jgi:hypothetical protein
MRILLVVLALAVLVSLPQASSAEDRGPARPSEGIINASPANHLPALLRTLGIVLIRNAHAAECTGEGETCTSNEQCCPGLECSGGPPATCVEED